MIILLPCGPWILIYYRLASVATFMSTWEHTGVKFPGKLRVVNRVVSRRLIRVVMLMTRSVNELARREIGELCMRT